MRYLLIILSLFVFSCDDSNNSPTGPNDDGGEGSDTGGEDIFPDIQLTDIDYVKDNPYGYLQFTSLRVKNNGNGSSSNYEYRIRPCVSYTNGAFDGSFTHNFSVQYLPALSPGEYYVIETNNETSLIDQSSNWFINFYYSH